MNDEKTRCSDSQDMTAQNSAAVSPGVDFSEFPPTNYDEWKEAAVAALKGAPFEKSLFTQTYEGIKLEPLYTAEHTKDLEFVKTMPGEPPLVRGTRVSGYIASPWEIAQESDAPSAAEANEITVHDFERGASTITPRLDEATLEGADSKSPADGGGVPISSLSDAMEFLKGIDISKHSLHVHAGTSSAALLGFFSEAANRSGFSVSDLNGCIGADPIGLYLKRGAIPRGLGRIFDEIAHTIRYAKSNAPKLRTILLGGSIYHNGGGNSVQEVAYVMASAIEIVHAMRDRGIDIDAVAERIRFEFSLGSNFFMEIAKIRGARLIWSRIAESFGGTGESLEANIFGRTSSFTKTVYDPYVNILRNTTEAFSGVVGGLDGLTVARFNEATHAGDEFSRRISRNAQIMLQNEFHLLQPIDPAGGSWYIESLTDTFAKKVWEVIQEIEGKGGIIAAIKEGRVQAAVDDILQQRFKKLAGRSDRAVGTNMYPNTGETPLRFAEPDVKATAAKREKELQKAKSERSDAEIGTKLESISKDLGGDLIEHIIGAARSGATIGEISGALGAGSDPEPKIQPLREHRWTEQFEAMRKRTEDYRDKTGDNVKIFLANMGPIPQHKARADFITGFMEVGNFKVLKNDGFKTVEECAEAAVASGADLAVICSTDDTYPELAPPLAESIKKKKSSMKVFLAGAPAEEFKQSYVNAGVDDFISVRSNCLAVLTDLQKAKGMM
ncbi:MAG: acyl-CoA mutase large subunit family protein [Synergistaceae bacterium]|jgi:methylmalonyl-CoA mutase|nr:acyl-CoA mutase large subunit family protein [Synergistaceae bacterium]